MTECRFEPIDDYMRLCWETKFLDGEGDQFNEMALHGKHVARAALQAYCYGQAVDNSELFAWCVKHDAALQFSEWNGMAAVTLLVNDDIYEAVGDTPAEAISKAQAEALKAMEGAAS